MINFSGSGKERFIFTGIQDDTLPTAPSIRQFDEHKAIIINSTKCLIKIYPLLTLYKIKYFDNIFKHCIKEKSMNTKK